MALAQLISLGATIPTKRGNRSPTTLIVGIFGKMVHLEKVGCLFTMAK